MDVIFNSCQERVLNLTHWTFKTFEKLDNLFSVNGWKSLATYMVVQSGMFFCKWVLSPHLVAEKFANHPVRSYFLNNLPIADSVWWSWIRAQKKSGDAGLMSQSSRGDRRPPRYQTRYKTTGVDPTSYTSFACTKSTNRPMKEKNETKNIITSTPTVLTCKYITYFPWLK